MKRLPLTTASIKAILAGRTDQTLMLERLKRPAGGELEEQHLPDRRHLLIGYAPITSIPIWASPASKPGVRDWPPAASEYRRIDNPAWREQLEQPQAVARLGYKFGRGRDPFQALQDDAEALKEDRRRSPPIGGLSRAAARSAVETSCRTLVVVYS